MASELNVFISSKMQELAPERKLLQELLPRIGQDTFHLHPWIFEGDAPASNKSIRDVYMEALQNSALYIGLFWNDFGEWTIDEFERASEWGIERHIYVKNSNPERRDPRLQHFLDKQSDVRFGITPRWYSTLEELQEQITHSIEKWMLDRQIAYHNATSAILAQIADDVPEQPKSLIGREDLIEETQELLADDAHVLLHGFGGMGKTALAATIAAGYVSSGRGPVIWLRAGAVEADILFEALGRAFGAQQTIASTSGEERIKAVRHLLVESKGLLVLDDVWNGTSLASMMKALPRKMPLLVTSRHRFPLDEILEIGELTPKQALKLLNLYVRGRDLSADADAARLCEVLGYHPFALEIAGKSLKVYRLTPSELLKQIADAPHDLTMPANFGEQGRTGMKSLLDASVSALHKTLHDVFVAMGGMFEPSATPELLALTMKATAEQVGDALVQLEQRGLVNARKHNAITYYRLHDLAYSYARTMFLNKGLSRQAVIEACRDYTAAFKDDLDALEVEQSNILEAAESAYQDGQIEPFIDMMSLLTVEGTYFASRGHTALSLNLLKTAIETSKERGELEAAHYFLSKIGNAYADFIGDVDSALTAYREALELAQHLNDQRREAILLTVIAKMRFRQGAEDSDTYYDRAEAIASASGDEWALSFVYHHRGYQVMNKKPNPDYETGRELADKAAKIAARLELEDIQFWSLINRGSCEYELQRYADALATHQEALVLTQNQNNHDWSASVLRSMGEDYHGMENREQAQGAFDEALTLWRHIKATAQINDLIEYLRKNQYHIQPE